MMSGVEVVPTSQLMGTSLRLESPKAMSRKATARAATVRRDGQLLVQGRMVHVFVDPATMAKKEIPANVRAGLEPYATA